MQLSKNQFDFDQNSFLLLSLWGEYVFYSGLRSKSIVLKDNEMTRAVAIVVQIILNFTKDSFAIFPLRYDTRSQRFDPNVLTLPEIWTVKFETEFLMRFHCSELIV